MNRKLFLRLSLLMGMCGLVALPIYADSFRGSEKYIGIEALYWKPMHEPIFVAKRSFNNTGLDPARAGSREELYLRGNYDLGGRLRVGCSNSCWFTDISYLYFNSDHSEQMALDDFTRLIILSSPPNPSDNWVFIKSTEAFRYQNADVRMGHFFSQGLFDKLYVYANARWAKIDFKQKTRALQEGVVGSDFVRQDAHFNGAGIGAGVGGRYALWWNFGFVSNVGANAIIGETNLKNFSAFIVGGSLPEVFLSKPERWCHILPALDCRFGIDFFRSFRSFSLKAEVGYELNYYWNVLRYASLNFSPLQSLGERVPLLSTQDIGFGGLYANITAIF